MAAKRASNLKFDAFMSYSHAADGQLAPALQAGMQRLAKAWHRRRALHVFRDETGLSTNPHLWSSIEAGLDASEWFVLLASPESAASEWVDREIRHWLETNTAERILPVVTGGQWRWDPATRSLIGDAVPPALSGALHDEPRHLDLRWARSEVDLDLRNSRFRSAVADVAATVHGVPKDELEGEDIRQHRRAQWLARGAVSTLGLLLVFSLASTTVAVLERRHADDKASEATRSRDDAIARGLAAAADLQRQSRDLELAALLAVQSSHFAAQVPDNAAGRRSARNTLLRVLGSNESVVGVLNGFDERLQMLRFSSDGALVAAFSDTGAIRVWDAETRRPLERQPDRLDSVPPVPTDAEINGRGVLATATAFDGVVRLWDVRNGRAWPWQPPAPDVEGGVYLTRLALSDDGVLAVLGGDAGQLASWTLDLWDIDTGERLIEPMTAVGTFGDVALAPGGGTVAVASGAEGGVRLDVRIVDVATGTVSRTLREPRGSFAFTSQQVSSFAFSSDGQRLAAAVSGPPLLPDYGGAEYEAHASVVIWDVESGARLPTSSTADLEQVIALTPDLQTVITTGPSTPTGAASVRNIATGRVLSRLPVAPGGAFSGGVASFDPTGRVAVFPLASGAMALANWEQIGLLADETTGPTGADDTLVATPTAGFIDVTPLIDELDAPASIEVATGASRSLAAFADGVVAIWDADAGRIVRTLTGIPDLCGPAPDNETRPRNLAFQGTPNAGRVVLACAESILSWDLAAGDEPAWSRPLSDNTSSIGLSPVLSPEGARLALFGLGGSVIWDAVTGREDAKGPSAVADAVLDAAFSADGRTLALAHASDAVDLVDASTGARLRTLAGRSSGAGRERLIALSPDGYLVARWSDAGVEVWDLASGDYITQLDGRRFADDAEPNTGFPNRTGAIALAFTGKERVVLTESPSFRHRTEVADDPRGARSVTWSLETDDLVDAACKIADRELTRAEWQNFVGDGADERKAC